jgi:hypothetical protein
LFQVELTGDSVSRKISQSGKTASALEADRCKVGKNYRPELDVVRFWLFYWFIFHICFFALQLGYGPFCQRIRIPRALSMPSAIPAQWASACSLP